MSTSFDLVECPACGLKNIISAENTTIEHFDDHPELEHLVLACEGSACRNDISVWTTRPRLQLAVRMGCRSRSHLRANAQVQSEFRSLARVYQLTKRCDEDIARLGLQLETCTDAQDAIDQMEGGPDYIGCHLPITWTCKCSSCLPDLIPVGPTPLKTL